MRTADRIKVIITAYLTFTQFISFSQRIGYEWIKTVDNSSQVLSIFDKENKLIVATNGSIRKYDTDGNLIWTVNDTLFNASGIAVDNKSNFYLTGTNSKYIYQSQYSYTEISYIYIAKYDNLGSRVWVSTTSVQTTNYSSESNFSTSIACDLNNALYITGRFTNSISFDSYQLTDNNYSAIFIAKYDKGGTAQWAKKMFGISDSCDGIIYGQGNEIAIDHTGFIYVTGSYRGTFDFGGTVVPCHFIGEIFLTKLDSNGVFLNTKAFGGNEVDEGARLVVDKNNALIMLAKFGDTISINGNQYQAINNYNNAIIIKLVNDSIVFATQIGPSNGGGIISDICLDQNQNIIYVGSISNGSTVFPMIYRISSTGQIDWSYTIAENVENNILWNNSIVSDASGGLYLAGAFNNIAYFGDTLLGAANTQFQIFLGKIDTTKHYPNIFTSDNSSSIIIFPTLTHGNLTILSLEKNLVNSILYLFNSAGQIVKQFSLSANQSELQINELCSGIYIAEIIGDNFREKFKIMKY